MDESLVEKAVVALQKHHTVSSKTGKAKLIEENPIVSLIIALKKIPDHSGSKPHRIVLPHSVFPPEETEMCLFTMADKKTVKELLERKNVKGVAKIVPLAKLKTDFKSYESKRRLSAMYDVFLADRRILHLLPHHLGKKFFEKKKFPFAVNMKRKDLSEEIKRAKDSTYLHLGLGSCCAVPIGRINNPPNHLQDNIVTGMTTIANKIPRGWRNIQAVNVKTVDSIALPIYNSAPLEATLLPDADRGPERKVMRLETHPEEHSAAADMPAGKSPKISKLSSKKIKGSTVISSTYQKTLKKRRTTK